ncbi:hypothetical protein FRC02_000774 [Tulasnella sp. 418]|nr:hypothetical protein FRC02_000774 [Tulasnella sp. 418]
MGDDEPITSATSVPDHSVQIGNLQNQLNSTNQSLNSTKASRVSLEQDISNSASMLAQLETQLALAKASYETESRLLSDLRGRYAKLQADIKTTREQLIRAESDLSAMRVEKTEIEGHVLRDKEEIRDLQRKMKQVADETELVKKDLEKAKKDVRHQKGLLAINKKQLVTAETERDKVEKELEVENKELELVNTELEAAQKAEQQEAAHFKKDIEQTPETFLTPLESLSPVGSPVINAGSKNPFAAFAAASASGGSSMSNQPSGPFLPFGTPSSPPVEPTSLNSPTTSQIHDDPFGIASTTASAPVSTPPPIASQIASPTGVATPVRAASPVNRVSTPVLVPQRVSSPIRTGSPVARVGSPLARAVTTSTPPPGHGSRSSTPQIVPTPPQPTSATTSPPKADNAEKPAGQEAETKFPSLDVLGGVTPLEDKDELDLELPPLKEIEEADEDTSSEEDSDDYADARVNGAKAAPVATATTSTQEEEHKKESTSSSAFDDAFGTGTERSSGSGVQVSPPSIGSFPETGTWNNEAIKESNNTTPTPLTIEPAATTTTSAISGASAFDDAFGWKPLDTPATTAQNGSTVPSTMSVPGGFKFDTSFDEGFDFNSFANEAAPAAPAPAPAPLAASSSAFDDAFGVSKAAPAQPTGTFSFDDAFGVKVPASGPSISPAPQQASAVPSLPTLSFDDAFGVSGLTPQPSVQPPQEPAQEPSPSYSPFSTGPLMPGMSPISTSAPVSASAPTPTTYAPPAGPPPGVTLPPRPSSPSGSNSFTSPTRQSTTTDRSASPKPSHKESPTSLRVKAPDAGPRPVSSLFGSSSSSPPPGAPAPAKSKFHFPGFGRSKTTKKRAKSPAPEPVPTPSGRFGRSTSITSATDAAAAGEDVEGVKQICAMGFTRDQAVTALERHSYNVARALESLLEENPGTT